MWLDNHCMFLFYLRLAVEMILYNSVLLYGPKLVGFWGSICRWKWLLLSKIPPPTHTHAHILYTHKYIIVWLHKINVKANWKQPIGKRLSILKVGKWFLNFILYFTFHNKLVHFLRIYCPKLLIFFMTHLLFIYLSLFI